MTKSNPNIDSINCMAVFNAKQTTKDGQKAALGKERICDAIVGKFWVFRL